MEKRIETLLKKLNQHYRFSNLAYKQPPGLTSNEQERINCAKYAFFDYFSEEFAEYKHTLLPERRPYEQDWCSIVALPLFDLEYRITDSHKHNPLARGT
mgnify:CR=1 FL=1